MSKIHNILVKVPPNSTIEFGKINVRPFGESENATSFIVQRIDCLVHEMSIIYDSNVTKLTDTGDSYYACLLESGLLHSFISSAEDLGNIKFCTTTDVINLPERGGGGILIDKFNITVLNSMTDLSRYHINFSDNTAFYVLDGELYIRYREAISNPT
jgi:hypothetical protein